MVAPSAGGLVLVPFPFSDLSQAKLRPAAALAEAGRGDWILCQVTSNPMATEKPCTCPRPASRLVRFAPTATPGLASCSPPAAI